MYLSGDFSLVKQGNNETALMCWLCSAFDCSCPEFVLVFLVNTKTLEFKEKLQKSELAWLRFFYIVGKHP